MKLPKQLILQFRMNEHGTTDGHDMGSGEMNLFVIVDTWKRGIWFMQQYLKNQPWMAETVLAKDNRDGSFDVVWPNNFDGVFEPK